MKDQSGSLKARLEAIVEEMVERGILFEDACQAFEGHFIRTVLARNGGNISKAAGELRIHRNTLSKRAGQMEPAKKPKRRAKA
jgi:transcriptional regulator with PAS, ATPase and Fis domain